LSPPADPGDAARVVVPPPQRLKCTEPDLTVLVGTPAQLFSCYPNILASHSEYIDTMLASSIGLLERQTREIRFPDILRPQYGSNPWLFSKIPFRLCP